MQVRLDTYLWAIRLFKSRSLSSVAIKGSKVKLNDAFVKPSHFVKIGETFTINTGGGHKKIIEVLELIEKRKEFELVKACYIDHSPPIVKKVDSETNIFKLNIQLERGSGRPTKKNRRDLGKEGGWF